MTLTAKHVLGLFIYFINISAPGKQNVNVTAPVVYTYGLNSISFYRKVCLIASNRKQTYIFVWPYVIVGVFQMSLLFTILSEYFYTIYKM
jgi:hypothetical protein